MTAPVIEIRHVVRAHQVVDATITHPDGTPHRVGHLPIEGWYCCCPRGKRCPAIQTIRDLIPAIGPPSEQEATTTTP